MFNKTDTLSEFKSRFQLETCDDKGHKFYVSPNS